MNGFNSLQKCLIAILGLMLGVGLLFCASPQTAFAQGGNVAESAAADDAQGTQDFQSDQPLYYGYYLWRLEPYTWEEASKEYSSWGWGLFGSGLAVGALGITLMATETDRKIPLRYLFGANTLVIGSGLFISGIGLLIANAVKSNRYSNAGNDANTLDIWEQEANGCRRWGWGLFASGLAVGITGGLMAGFGMTDKLDGDYVMPGLVLSLIGGEALIAGIGLLIADAVKFNPYRELKKRGLSMMPNFYITPEFTGLGISGRF